MNQDIVYEILKFLHLCPEENDGPLLFRRVIFSRYSFWDLEFRSFEKPIVLIIKGKKAKFRSILNRGSTVYWGDGSVEFIDNKSVDEELTSDLELDFCSEYESGSEDLKCKKDQFFSDTEEDSIYWKDDLVAYDEYFAPCHRYSDEKFHTIKIFNNIMYTMLPENTTNLVSIGEMRCLNILLASCNELNGKIGKKWDTSRVVSVHRLFYNCIIFDKNIGRKWNTSKITNMNGMFENCHKLNKNVGKNWDTSRVRSMARMFRNCKRLNQKIGKRWDTSNVEQMYNMFQNCTRLTYPIGENWDLSKCLDEEFV